MDKRDMLIKQFNQTQKQENKILNQKENALFKEKMKPALDKLQEKIPTKIRTGLDTAFYKGFMLVFEKGSPVIEKTYNKEKLEIDYDLNNYAVDKHSSKRHIKRMDRSSNQSKALNQSIAAVEGGVLGLLGIGLADIPIFLSVMVKTINEIALHYGYPYNTQKEKIFMLSIICGALSKGEAQKMYSEKIDTIGRSIDSAFILTYDLDEVMKETSTLLSTTLLTAKVIQGIPIVGILGGTVNPVIIHKLGKYAKVKYKKRFLQKKILEQQK
ncbi:MAG: EcsC family protein [Candidatus Galacturonibacter soehngenii]|nr:EcsC family protein [Candidatus Galacturonibacter soehngenii]